MSANSLTPIICDCCLRKQPALDMGKYKGRNYCHRCIEDARAMQMEVQREMGGLND